MKKYISTLIVNAEPMTLGEAISQGLCKVTDDYEEDIDSTIPGYKVIEPDGYERWMSEKAFKKEFELAESYIDRLYAERKELANKFQKLCIFVGDKKFKENVLDEEERFMLMQQQYFMSEYLRVLNMRLKSAVKSEEN